MLIPLVVAAVLAAAPAGPPRVVAVSPAVGAEIAAGKIQISVTYDQPMMPGGYSFTVGRALENVPKCEFPPTQSPDGKTFTASCVVEVGKDYWIGLNNDRYKNFQSTEGVPAVPAMMQFSAH